MSKVLITGGAGFIGSHVVERFLSAGHEVTVIDDLSTGRRDYLPTVVDLRVMDVGSREAAALIEKGRFEIIAHLAAQIDVRLSVSDPQLDARTNILGTLNMLEAVRATAGPRPRVVFASTGGALYGASAPLPADETCPPQPDAPYGVAKLAAETYLGYYARVWSIDAVTLRFGNVYGPRQNPHGDAGVVAIFAGRIVARRPLTVFGSGSQTRDFVYVGDVAEAFLAAATTHLPPAHAIDTRAFNIGSGVETSVADLANKLSSIAGVPATIDFQSERVGELQRSLLDVSKARRVLGWQSRVSLDEGLRRTFAWARGLDQSR